MPETSTGARLMSELRRALRAHADAERAEPMQRYMKSEMPYYGIQTPVRRQLQKPIFAAHPLETFEAWQAVVLELWRTARYREERYCALELAALRAYDGYQTLATLPMYEEMIVDGAWWDTVDEIATHRLRRLLEKSPGRISRTMRSWSRDENMWKRRSAILCQVGRKTATDLGLLYDCIEPNLETGGRQHFFIRKGIGWALRDYAWTDPDEVERYVAEKGEALSGLSRREATKNLAKVRAKRKRQRAGAGGRRGE